MTGDAASQLYEKKKIDYGQAAMYGVQAGATTYAMGVAMPYIEKAAVKWENKIFKTKTQQTNNYVYRALNAKDYEQMLNGHGLEAKNPNGTWNLNEHIIGGSSLKSWKYDPYISTTSDINIARKFNQIGSDYGIIQIDLNKVTSPYYKAYEIYPRANGISGIPYHYSIWQQEISIYQNIPRNAIVRFVK